VIVETAYHAQVTFAEGEVGIAVPLPTGTGAGQPQSIHGIHQG